MTKYNGQHQS